MPSDAPTPAVLLEPVASEQSFVLRNLFEFYAHDFSELVPLDVKDSGRFDAPVGEEWWTASDHFPFFIRSRGKLGGFALVRRGSRITGDRDVTDMSEFFVLRGARRMRVGTFAAHALFARFPGRWEIRMRAVNRTARAFWPRAVETWKGERPVSQPLLVDGVAWEVIRFDSRQ